jgi:alpha-1,3-rhamnosyl/mannosyltransferase
VIDMRVLVNGLPAAGAKTGIGHYTSQLLRCLREQAGTDSIHSFGQGWMEKAKSVWGQVRARAERTGALPAPGAGRPGWKARALDLVRRGGQAVIAHQFRAASRRGYDLFHEPNFIPVPCELPGVVTVHDLSVVSHPEWHPADRVAYFERHFHNGLAGCNHVLAISEFARQEIIQTLGIPPTRVTRTYMGVRPGLGPLPPQAVRQTLLSLGLPERYLLHLGTLEPRKNVLLLLRAYCSLAEAIRSKYPLILVGGWGWNSREVYSFLADEARHRGVRHLGYVPDHQLSALYNGARSLLFPSHYEGFGLPPVEMLACGGAVLASTAGAVAETVGKQAHLIDPVDLDGWRSALIRVTTDDDWWAQLRRGAVEAAKPFTWDRCAADTLAVYRSVYRSTHGRLAA